MEKKKPKLKVVGQDGNAFFILGRAVQALRAAKYSDEEIAKYKSAAMSGDYNNLLAVTCEWCEVS